MAEMTDAERDILNRLLAEDESDMTVDDLLRLPPGAVSMFRRLAESQQALGEINRKVCKAIYYLMKDSPKHPDGRSKEISYFEHGMDRLMDAKKIARNARKGGKK